MKNFFSRTSFTINFPSFLRKLILIIILLPYNFSFFSNRYSPILLKKNRIEIETLYPSHL